MRSDICLWIYLHSLMASDPEHISTCLLTICSSLFEKCLFLSLAHFLTKLLVALLCFFTFLHVLDVNPLLQIFSSILWADSLLHYFLTVQKFQPDGIPFVHFFAIIACASGQACCTGKCSVAGVMAHATIQMRFENMLNEPTQDQGLHTQFHELLRMGNYAETGVDLQLSGWREQVICVCACLLV